MTVLRRDESELGPSRRTFIKRAATVALGIGAYLMGTAPAAGAHVYHRGCCHLVYDYPSAPDIRSQWYYQTYCTGSSYGWVCEGRCWCGECISLQFSAYTCWA